MPSPTRVWAPLLAVTMLCQVVASGERAFASSPTQIWSQGAQSGLLSPENGQLLPAELLPAFRFQVIYGKILSGAKAPEWRSDLADFAMSQAGDPVSSGIRDVARVWLARVEMEDIDALLLDYYTHNIYFPKTDADFQKLLPPGLARDPWGQPWVYSPQTPHGFSSAMSGQRYQLSPTAMPGLQSLTESVKSRQPLKLSSTVIPRDVAGRHALEFHSSQSVTMIEPGGRVESCTLMYVGDHWALLSGDDRIFAIPF